MCSPIIAGMAVSALTAGMQYMQGRQQAAGIKAEAQANAQVQQSNAAFSRQSAQDAMQRGASEAANIRENVRRANSELNAKAGGSGLLTNTGSLLDFFVQNRQVGELDALTTINNAEREAYGYKVQAAQNEAGAANTISLGSYQAKTARMAGLTSAAGTLLTGFGSAYQQASGNGGNWFGSSASGARYRNIGGTMGYVRVS